MGLTNLKLTIALCGTVVKERRIIAEFDLRRGDTRPRLCRTFETYAPALRRYSTA
jgi:hypothetical protein